MLIIAGEIRVKPGSRDEFFPAVASMVAASRDEPGCRAYAFTPDPYDDELIRIFEVWDDDDSLSRHFGSAHMAAWRERRESLDVTSRDLTRYTVAESQPLPPP